MPLRSWEIQVEVDVARRLQLAAIAHIYPVLPFIVRYSCLLARMTRVGVTRMRWYDADVPNIVVCKSP